MLRLSTCFQYQLEILFCISSALTFRSLHLLSKPLFQQTSKPLEFLIIALKNKLFSIFKWMLTYYWKDNVRKQFTWVMWPRFFENKATDIVSTYPEENVVKTFKLASLHVLLMTYVSVVMVGVREWGRNSISFFKMLYYFSGVRHFGGWGLSVVIFHLLPSPSKKPSGDTSDEVHFVKIVRLVAIHKLLSKALTLMER